MRKNASIILLFSFLSVWAQDYKSEVIRQVLRYQMYENKLIETDSVMIQINDRAGDNAARISIPYSKGDKISIGDVWIEDKNGNIVRKLKKNEITDQNAILDISLYQDDFIKIFELKHNDYPYRLFYTYKIIYNKYLAVYRFNPYPHPVRSMEVVVECPSEKDIIYEQKNIDEPIISNVKNGFQYVWKFDHKGYKPEYNANYKNTDFPQLSILPLYFKYGMPGSFADWKEYGNWYYKLNKGKNLLPETEKRKIESLLNGVTDVKEKAKALYKYLQDYTRYINVSIDLGGLQTYPAQYVCENRYGDCKALSNYMKAMLEYVGIDSYFTLVRSDEKIPEFNRDFPYPEFNHVILTIPFTEDTVYLECTSKNISFGYIHSGIQGRQALLIDETDSRLINIPSFTKEDVLTERTCLVMLNSSNLNAEIEMNKRNRGEEYEFTTFLSKDANKNSMDKFIRNSIFPGTLEIRDYKFDLLEENVPVIDFAIKFNVSNFYKRYGKNIVITPLPLHLDLSQMEIPENRNFDFQINIPVHKKDTIVYDLSGFEISKIPENIKLDTPFGNYSYVFQQIDNKLYLYKSIWIEAGYYPAEQYENLYGFIYQIRKNEVKNIYLETL